MHQKHNRAHYGHNGEAAIKRYAKMSRQLGATFYYYCKVLLVTLMYPAKMDSANTESVFFHGAILAIKYLQTSQPRDYLAILTRFTTSNCTNRLIGLGEGVI